MRSKPSQDCARASERGDLTFANASLGSNNQEHLMRLTLGLDWWQDNLSERGFRLLVQDDGSSPSGHGRRDSRYQPFAINCDTDVGDSRTASLFGGGTHGCDPAIPGLCGTVAAPNDYGPFGLPGQDRIYPGLGRHFDSQLVTIPLGKRLDQHQLDAVAWLGPHRQHLQDQLGSLDGPDAAFKTQPRPVDNVDALAHPTALNYAGVAALNTVEQVAVTRAEGGKSPGLGQEDRRTHLAPRELLTQPGEDTRVGRCNPPFGALFAAQDGQLTK